jgi:MbtH protein
MTNPFDDPATEFCVLRNSEGQHSLWPTFREVPAGWTPVGPVGTRESCARWVDEHWTDMTPASLRAASQDGRLGQTN